MDLNIKNTKAEYSDETIVERYIACVDDIGLWQSEKIIFDKYINPHSKILDLGCGAGRTTFGLYELGFRDVIGLDLSEKMIAAAQKLARDKDTKVSFVAGNACALSFESSVFDTVIFSFNGIMTIPSKEMRQKAFDEIYRVLRPGGIFIFTTHDINNRQFTGYWNDERVKWEKGQQDKRLLEYGDLIFSKPEDYGDAVSFVHVPVDGEVEMQLKEGGFDLIYSGLRSGICEESPEVLDFSVDCRFWVGEKK